MGNWYDSRPNFTPTPPTGKHRISVLAVIWASIGGIAFLIGGGLVEAIADPKPTDWFWLSGALALGFVAALACDSLWCDQPRLRRLCTMAAWMSAFASFAAMTPGVLTVG